MPSRKICHFLSVHYRGNTKSFIISVMLAITEMNVLLLVFVDEPAIWGSFNAYSLIGT